MRILPIGIHSFDRIRRDNCIYVDKTEYAYNMITRGYRYFLSRPRRFGKSLFVSTLKEILSANKKIFNDLWIMSSDYHWIEHGVIALDFSRLDNETPELLQLSLQHELLQIAKQYGVTIDTSSPKANTTFESLINALHERFGRVAILVDEYDSPILRLLNTHEHATAIRTAIQQLFTVVKSLDSKIDFVFITGVSSFVRAGLFSGINNLTIMSLDERYAGLCGYTDQEIDLNFSDYITEWACKENQTYEQLRKEIQAWYNGYHFGYNVAAIYNPFSFMKAIDSKDFDNFWFLSGMPTFLVDVFKKEHTKFDPEKLKITKEDLGVFDIGATPLLALMFQTGYLTINSYDKATHQYTLTYPNLEVKRSLQKYLLGVFVHLDERHAHQLALDMRTAFNNGLTSEAVTYMQELFTHIPYQIHMPEEKFYHALLQMACITAGIKTHSEYSTSHGRIDLVLDLPNIIYVTEVKFNKTAQEALDQIEKRRYYEQFITEEENKPVILLGLCFNRKPGEFDITYIEKRLSNTTKHK